MIDLLLQNAGIVLFIALVCLGYGAGSIAEKRHFHSLVRREKQLAKIVTSTNEEVTEFGDGDGELVTGSVVISIDYFKRLLAFIRNILGGRVSSYESLVERARREAILRMKECAAAKGYTTVVNVRVETAAIGSSANQKRQIGSVETIAYGTAIRH